MASAIVFGNARLVLSHSTALSVRVVRKKIISVSQTSHYEIILIVSSEANHRGVLTHFDIEHCYKTLWLDLFHMSFDTKSKASNEAYVCLNTHTFLRHISVSSIIYLFRGNYKIKLDIF